MESDDLNDDSTISVHDWNVQRARKRYEAKFFNFWHFLHDFPMMGLAHPIGKKILRELERAPKIAIVERPWFRAQPKKEFLASMAPPELVGDQRYNNAGQVYRYFANTAECAVAECANQSEAKTVWVQQFRIEGLKDILDLRSWDDEDERADQNDESYRSFLIALVFCELLTQNPEHYFDQKDKSAIKWKPAYLMTRFIADSVRYCGFSGILYRSIRYRGDNLVLFNCDRNAMEDGAAQEHSLIARPLIVKGRCVL